MPDSAAVYQPTTVGYSYDAGVDGNEGGVGLGAGTGIRNGFSRILSRHQVSTRKWLEWVLLTVAICAIVVGLKTMVVNLVTAECTSENNEEIQNNKTAEFDIKNEDKLAKISNSGSLALGGSIIFLGLLLGALWTWLRFFHRGGKSQRSGMSRASGQMLGGLNPSTDLLVGSTSQYGPVLTEVPSQLTNNKQIINETSRVIPLSDHEEETHTLMAESTVTNQTPVINDSNHTTNQLTG